MQPINLMGWIAAHRDILKPPVGNKVVWEDREFIVMVVGGPNARTDYHINEGEEFFYQIEGDIILRVLEDGMPKDVPIRAGEIFLLPPNVPHSPQRPAGSIGLVIERRRLPHEQDGFLWICPRCHTRLYEEYFHLTDIEKQLPPVFERFYGDAERSTCKTCGARVQRNGVEGR